MPGGGLWRSPVHTHAHTHTNIHTHVEVYDDFLVRPTLSADRGSATRSRGKLNYFVTQSQAGEKKKILIKIKTNKDN